MKLSLAAKEKAGAVIQRLFRIFPIDKKKIVFSCFLGRRYGDSPRAIAEEIIRQGLDYHMVWLMKDGYKADLPPEIKRKPLTLLSQVYHLATAKVWVDSHRKPLYVHKRKNQYYINTWHGGFGKKVGRDSEKVLSENDPVCIRHKHNSKLVDLYLSNSRAETEQFRRALWYEGEVLECGFPKNDVYFEDHTDTKRKVREALHIKPEKKILLYAPTFRSDHELHYYSLDYEMVTKALKAKFGGEWCVLVRLHPLIIEKAKDFITYTDDLINATEYENMQDLLVSADAYITDYSSPMFEFCLLKKPVFLFATDYEDFMKDRGWYLDYFNMPFPAAQSNEELCRNIAGFSQEIYEKKLSEFWESIGQVETGTATKEAVKVIKRIMS